MILGNYWPISSLPYFSKVLEEVTYKEFTNIYKNIVFSIKTSWLSKSHSTRHEMIDQTKSSSEKNDLTCEMRFPLFTINLNFKVRKLTFSLVEKLSLKLQAVYQIWQHKHILQWHSTRSTNKAQSSGHLDFLFTLMTYRMHHEVLDLIMHAGEHALLIPQYQNSFLHCKLRVRKTLINSDWTSRKLSTVYSVRLFLKTIYH